jgi:protein-disulfide isomerase
MAAARQTGRNRSRRGTSASSRPTWFYFVLGGIVLLGVGGLAYVALRPATPTPLQPPQLPADLAELGPAQPYTKGDTAAPVHIQEFADFECPACARFAIITHPDVRARIVDAGRAHYSYYDLPLPHHLHSYPASHAAACADEQGRFWEMHDQVYASQDRWSTRATNNPRGIFRNLARDIGLNVRQWEQCYDSQRYQQRIDANHAESIRRGVNSTPTFIVNGQVLRGAISFDEMRRAVDSAAARAAAGTPATP